MSVQEFSQLLHTYIDQYIPNKEPKNLYEPMRYILDLGGKRLRPLLVMMSANGYGVDSKDALPAAMAIEVFHNFTLVHDDIMDHASIRRGQETVHKRWNQNIGILSGDMMLAKAFQYLESYDAAIFKSLSKLLSKTAIEVCEGQQYDIDFESNTSVKVQDYIQMIRLKTAVLLGCSLQMGAIVAQQSTEIQQNCYDMGVQLGLAFQLQDDYLDSFGDESTFGKKIGGDILENKKTWLYLMTSELCSEEDFKNLNQLQQLEESPLEKISQTKALYIKYKVDKLIKDEILKYSSKASKLLKQLDLTRDMTTALRGLIEKLNQRNH